MSSEVVEVAMKKGSDYARKEIAQGKLMLSIIAEKKPKDLLPGMIDNTNNVYLAEFRKAWDVTFKISLDLSSGGEIKLAKLKVDEEILEKLRKIILMVSNLSLFYQEKPEASYIKLFNLADDKESLKLLKRVDEILIKPLMDKASRRV
ncbi:MAG: hypothetical protein QXX95_07065 [Nitrososphaerales archaeon]